MSVQAFTTTRYFRNSTEVPNNCVPHPDVNSTWMFEYLEEDITWAVVTFACIHLPSVVGAMHFALPARLETWLWRLTGKAKDIVARLSNIPSGSISHYCVCPASDKSVRSDPTNGTLECNIPFWWRLAWSFPPAHAADFHHPLRFGEKSSCDSSGVHSEFHNHNQQNCNWSVPEWKLRVYDTIHRKCLGAWKIKWWFIHDSMLKGRSLRQKLELMAKFSPAFLTSMVFKVGSISIVCAFLKGYSVKLSIGFFFIIR